ncbi:MAG: hypothetical protein LBB78_04680 [Spirochaetaceae bacterium]|jgi:hypothetical protein|nr:hypothetical protein [Spirochaetaceae bacterium]
MRTSTIVIYSSSQKISHEVECFVQEAQNREGGAGKVFRVHDEEDFRIKVEVYRPYLVFVESNCWYELTSYRLAHYRVKYRRMMICVFTYDRLMPAQAAGLMGNGDREIALKTGVSYGAAKNKLSALRRKLGVNRTGTLQVLAIKAGLVRFEELVNPEIDLKGLDRK